MNIPGVATFIFLTAVLAGCVDTTATQDVRAPETQPSGQDEGASPAAGGEVALLSPPEGKGRIIVYRGNTFGLGPNLATPQVKVDDVPSGVCKHTSIVVRDLPPGTYDVSIQTDVRASRSVSIAAGDVLFLRCNILPIGLVLPAPALDVVESADVPEKVYGLARQP